MKTASTGKRAETERKLWDAFESLRAAGTPTGPTAFAARVGIDRTYLYTFPALAAEISAYGRKTQPRQSRRGIGLTKEAAVQREVEAQRQREHQQWSREFPKLQQRLTTCEEQLHKQTEENQTLRECLARLRRAYELLLLLAVEAGVSPHELEVLREKVGGQTA